METILEDVKHLLGISPDDTSFDSELVMHINSVVTVLTQLGVGPEEGLITSITTTWSELIGERKDLEMVKSYIYLKVRLLFDPPQNSFLLASIDRQCQEAEWRIQVQASPSTTAEDPVPTTDEFSEDTYF